MKSIYTECSIALNDGNAIYGAHRIVIRVDDEGGGPYLVVRGVNDEPNDGETEHDFFLQSDEEIDQFADICKAMLNQANRADEVTLIQSATAASVNRPTGEMED